MKHHFIPKLKNKNTDDQVFNAILLLYGILTSHPKHIIFNVIKSYVIMYIECEHFSKIFEDGVKK